MKEWTVSQARGGVQVDLRTRYLAWVNMLMFVLGVGLAFQVAGLWADDPADEEARETWETRLESSTPSGADLSLTTAILNAYRLDAELNEMPIGVTTTAGVVVLTGAVDAEEKKKRAAGIASDIPGVEQVVNRLSVKPGLKPRSLPDLPRARRL